MISSFASSLTTSPSVSATHTEGTTDDMNSSTSSRESNRRRSTSDIPNPSSSNSNQAHLQSILEHNDGSGGAAGVEVVHHNQEQQPQDIVVTPNQRRAFSLSQSDRLPSRSNRDALYREDSRGSDYSKAAMKFLNVVKKVQMIKRVEKAARQRSAPASTPNRVGLIAPGDISHRNETTENGDAAADATETTPLNKTPESPDAAGAASTPGGGGGSGENDDYVFAERPTIAGYLYETICGKGVISLCLLAAPFALWAVHREWPDTWIFWLNFVVMIPLAAILGDFTEELALHTNQTIGGLINATFGNAVEVVVAIQALLANEIRVVQSSMLGSIFSNLLLVLGGCFFFGGLKYKEQKFNSTAASANMALLALSGIALVLPTPFADYYELHDEHVLLVSRFAAVFLMFMYLQLLVFQLHTHAEVFEDGEGDDEELAQVPFWVALTGLLVATLLVTIFSDFLVESIDGFVEASGISRTFVGIIILPIVGNAVEHITAITVAMKNKMDLAMGVAVGSCTQISLFVVPLTVLVGWVMDRDMNLNFPHFEVILFVMSVFTVSVVLSTPRCNWLEGSLLMTTYLLISVGFWFENVQKYDA